MILDALLLWGAITVSLAAAALVLEWGERRLAKRDRRAEP
jgi:hypothetical protein